MIVGKATIVFLLGSIVVLKMLNADLILKKQVPRQRPNSRKDILAISYNTVIKIAQARIGKLLYPNIVMLCVMDILALRSLAFKVTMIEPTIMVLTTVLNIVAS